MSLQHEVTVRRLVRRPAATVFRAFADGPTWSEWFSGNTEVDLRVGGRFRNDDGDCGEYLAIERDRLLRFTWEGSFHGSRVELRFAPQGDEACEVSLRHEHLAAAADAERLTRCWTASLDNLASFLET
jgi:uncharacterized protein YndB with AHSA1/START domain